jgi:hypothetical protein
VLTIGTREIIVAFDVKHATVVHKPTWTADLVAWNLRFSRSATARDAL